MARPQDPNAKVELLRAAEQVFVEHGLEKAHVEQITARAGRSKGSFYLHFESKEEAFRQIVESMTARLASFIDCMEPELVAEGQTPREILENSQDREVELFEFLWQNRHVMRLVMGGGGSAQFGYLIEAFAERTRERTKSMLQVGIERGLHRPDLDVEIASLVISGAYDRIARQIVRLDKKPDLRAWIRGIQRVLLAGISTDPVRAVFDQPVSHEVFGRNAEPPPVSTTSPTRVVRAARGGKRARTA
ncbi:MAG: TetR/AcrR family transcriptional regulator [Polyangiales bacterium]